MEEGKVVRFNAEKGWGFIRPDSGGEDVMLHVRELCDQRDADLLRRDVRVSFEVFQTDRGLRAADVRVLGNGPGNGRAGASGFRDEVTGVLSRAADQIEEIARRHGLAG